MKLTKWSLLFWFEKKRQGRKNHIQASANRRAKSKQNMTCALDINLNG